MIQFNLLPDIKLEYIKAKRLKRLIIGMSIGVASISLVLCLVLFFVVKSQENHSKNLKKDIDDNVSKLQSTKDLDKILTVQNQISSLNELHKGKKATTRVVKYLAQITPSNTTISKVSVDFAQSTMNLEGTTTDLLAVNKFVDTLKFTKLNVGGDQPKSGLAFSKVLLNNYGASPKSATYSISLSFDPVMFDNQATATLDVPRTITTRSENYTPESLFQQAPTKKEKEN